MLGFFPRLYPGELLYSVIARYQIRSGNLSPKLTIEELFNSRSITATADLPCGLDNLEYKPFGRSPWLCLNAAADHYLKPVITDLKVSHCLENKKPLGTFTCSCGMIYSRSGEDKTEEDKLRIGRVITYGRVWEGKLRELVEVKKLGLRATARELRVDPNTVKRYVALLNLTPAWTKNKPQFKPKKALSTDIEGIKELILRSRLN